MYTLILSQMVRVLYWYFVRASGLLVLSIVYININLVDAESALTVVPWAQDCGQNRPLQTTYCHVCHIYTD